MMMRTGGLASEAIHISSPLSHAEHADLWAFGNNEYGQLGTAAKATALTPTVVELSGRRVVAVACGESHTVAITTEGRVLAWGRGDLGQLGLGSAKKAQPQPKLVEAMVRRGEVVKVVCGVGHTAMLTRKGELFVTGANKYHQLGSNAGHNESEETLSLLPVPVPCMSFARTPPRGFRSFVLSSFRSPSLG